jgi:hypothetical protein
VEGGIGYLHISQLVEGDRGVKVLTAVVVAAEDIEEPDSTDDGNEEPARPGGVLSELRGSSFAFPRVS